MDISKGVNFAIRTNKIEYKINKDYLIFDINYNDIIKKKGFFTNEPDDKVLTSNNYIPKKNVFENLYNDDNSIKPHSNIPIFFLNLNLQISKGNNKNIWIYLNNQVIQFPLFKVHLLKSKINIICKINNSCLLEKKLNNINLLNKKNIWVTFDAITPNVGVWYPNTLDNSNMFPNIYINNNSKVSFLFKSSYLVIYNVAWTIYVWAVQYLGTQTDNNSVKYNLFQPLITLSPYSNYSQTQSFAPNLSTSQKEIINKSWASEVTKNQYRSPLILGVKASIALTDAELNDGTFFLNTTKFYTNNGKDNIPNTDFLSNIDSMNWITPTYNFKELNSYYTPGLEIFKLASTQGYKGASLKWIKFKP